MQKKNQWLPEEGKNIKIKYGRNIYQNMPEEKN